jgi:membrane-associated phospholipid phosphatase
VIARVVDRVGPDLLILGVFSLALAILTVVYGGQFSFVHASIVFPLVILVLLAIASLGSERSTLAILRDWFPLVAIVFVYENFHDLTDVIRPAVVDGALRHLDERLFSVEPTLAFQRVTRPWLTELMSLAYLTYFFYPTLILTVLYRRGEVLRFREFGLALSLAFYLGLTGYMLVPAVGPRYFFPTEFHVPLTGYWVTTPAANLWEDIRAIKRDCFPSLHTGLTAIALIYFWRYRDTFRRGRLMLWLFAPPIVLIWISTLYLRYHYAVDVAAGLALAVFCTRAAPAFLRWYYTRKSGTAPSLSTDCSGSG